MTRPLSYRLAGVDVTAAERFVEAIGPLVRSTHGPEVVTHASRFAGLLRPDLDGISDPVIAATCDGVGTKVLLATEPAHFEGLGRDLVAMNVNDLLPLGARPLLFLDYLAAGRLDADRLGAAVRGIAAACREAGCALLGGETAEMPNVHADGAIEMAGFAVGLVDGDRLPDPSAIRPGDPVVALPSTGLHSNGFTLARRALFDQAGLDPDGTVPGLVGTLGDVLRTPTAIYVDAVANVSFKAAAHITGGGLLGRLAALLPAGLGARIDPDTYTRPPILGVVSQAGGVPEEEMAATFNMGLGFVAVVDEAPEGWLRVGEVTEGGGVDLGYASR